MLLLYVVIGSENKSNIIPWYANAARVWRAQHMSFLFKLFDKFGLPQFWRWHVVFSTKDICIHQPPKLSTDWQKVPKPPITSFENIVISIKFNQESNSIQTSLWQPYTTARSIQLTPQLCRIMMCSFSGTKSVEMCKWICSDWNHKTMSNFQS